VPRPGGLDRADTESHEDYPERVSFPPEAYEEAPEHRYVTPQQYVSEKELDRRAQLDAMQDMADRGRPVHSIPWLGKARAKAKVKHRQWENRANGWAHCKRCAFPVPVTADGLKVQHQEEHAERDRVLTLQARDVDTLVGVQKDLQAQLDVAGEEIARQQLRIDALMLALGHPDQDALQAAVDEVMSIARQLNAQRKDDGT